MAHTTANRSNKDSSDTANSGGAQKSATQSGAGQATPDTSSADRPSTMAERQARSLELAMAAAKVADQNRGQNIVVLDLRHVTPIFDYFVIAEGTSRRQLHAISEEIDHKLEDDLNDQRLGIEGYQESRWILLDYGSVVIHVFDQETREYYDLEQLWAEAKRVDLTGIISPEPS